MQWERSHCIDALTYTFIGYCKSSFTTVAYGHNKVSFLRFNTNYDHADTAVCYGGKKVNYLALKTLYGIQRYLKSKIDCLRFVMCPLLALDFQGFLFFAAAINSTNEANKAGGVGHLAVYIT